MNETTENTNEQPAQISGEIARIENDQPISSAQIEVQPEPKKQWSRNDNLKPWKPGQSGNPSGRQTGLGFKHLVRVIANEIIDGKRTRSEALIDHAFARAIDESSDFVLAKLLDFLDDEPQQVEIIRRRLELRSTKPAPPVGVSRFAEQNGNGNGHAGSNGNGQA